jgi:hypothetical protein
MPLFGDSKDYEERYGEIPSVKIEFYYKYKFTLYLYLESGECVRIYTGGDSDNIYRYDPLSTDWSNHFSAEIYEVEDQFLC